jgi:hypothetical protein
MRWSVRVSSYLDTVLTHQQVDYGDRVELSDEPYNQCEMLSGKFRLICSFTHCANQLERHIWSR